MSNYTQQIINRGKIKYFISDRKADGTPVKTYPQIGDRSTWYVSADRPRHAQGALLGKSDYSTNPDPETAATSTFWENVYAALFKAAPSRESFLTLSPYRGSNNDYFLDIRNYTPIVEPYDDKKEYIDFRMTDTSDGKFGVRVDWSKKQIIFGIFGTIYLPEMSYGFFTGIVNNGTHSSIPAIDPTLPQNTTIMVIGGWDTILFIEEIVSDIKVKHAGRLFTYLPCGKQRLEFNKWSFKNCLHTEGMLYGIYGIKNQQTGDYLYNTGALKILDIFPFDTKLVIQAGSDKGGMFGNGIWDTYGQTAVNINTPLNGVILGSELEKIYTSEDCVLPLATTDTKFQQIFCNQGKIVGGNETVYTDIYSPSTPAGERHKDAKFFHWDEGTVNPGYFWNPNAMDPLTLIPGPQFNAIFLAHMNAAAAAANSDRAPAVQQLTGSFGFISESTKPVNLVTLSNNNVKESGDGVAYLGYTYNVTERTFNVYLVSDNVGKNNILANANCTNMFAIDDTVKGSLSVDIEWLNTKNVTNMQNMFGYNG